MHAEGPGGSPHHVTCMLRGRVTTSCDMPGGICYYAGGLYVLYLLFPNVWDFGVKVGFFGFDAGTSCKWRERYPVRPLEVWHITRRRQGGVACTHLQRWEVIKGCATLGGYAIFLSLKSSLAANFSVN